MNPLKSKQKNRLLHLIAKDIETASAIARTAACAAAHHAQAGRTDQAFQYILEAEPALFDVQKLVGLASYVQQLGASKSES